MINSKYGIIEWINPYRGSNEYSFVLNWDDVSDKDFKQRLKNMEKRGPKSFIDWVSGGKILMFKDKTKFVTKYSKLTGGRVPNLEDFPE